MWKIFVTSIFLGVGLVGNSALATVLEPVALPETLRALEQRCSAYSETDHFACPVIRAYRWTGLATAIPNPRAVNRAFAESFYQVEWASVDAAASAITDRLYQQIEAVREVFEVGEIERPVLLDSGPSFVRDLSAYIRGWEQLVFLDDNYYWAPSVNASAVILINPRTGLVIEILHGDTDG